MKVAPEKRKEMFMELVLRVFWCIEGNTDDVRRTEEEKLFGNNMER